MSKRLFKKLYGVAHFYTDSSNRFEFYYRKNWLDQFDIMVYDIENKTNRWFMVTPSVFFTFIGIDKDNTIHTFKRNIDGGMKPKLANEFINKHTYTLISHKVAKFNAETVVAKLGDFGPDAAREKVLLLKRVASVPEKEFMILGIDTIEIPFAGIYNFIKDVKKKHFKGIDLELELSSNEEDSNGIDKN